MKPCVNQHQFRDTDFALGVCLDTFDDTVMQDLMGNELRNNESMPCKSCGS